MPLSEFGLAAATPALERIFFASSRRNTFAGPADRDAFRERWLGRYLVHDPGHAFLTVSPAGEIIGYLVGCLDDPATLPRFADIDYFAELADLTQRYPAHLHINFDPAWRGRGLGTELIARFLAHANTLGAPGVHVVTGAASRNHAFYERNGFAALRRFVWRGGVSLMLGRTVGRQPQQ